MNRLHQQVQQNLEHFRESSREQRVAKSLAAEKREAALQQEISRLKTELTETQKGRAEADKALCVSQNACNGLREVVTQEMQEREHLMQAKQAIEKEHIRLQAAYDGLVKQEAGLQERYLAAQSQILDLEKNTVSLEGQLYAIQEKLRKAEDRVSVLEREKLFDIELTADQTE